MPYELLFQAVAAGRIDGVPCWPSISAVPCTVDLAVVCVPAVEVAAVLEDCGRHRVASALVISAGVSAVMGLRDRIRTIIDRTGMRLGWGRGYYDKTLGSMERCPPVYAVIFDSELVDEVPRERHDQAIDGVVTPTRTVEFSTRSARHRRI